MRRAKYGRRWSVLALITIGAAAFLSLRTHSQSHLTSLQLVKQTPSQRTRARLLQSYGKLPITFPKSEADLPHQTIVQPPPGTYPPPGDPDNWKKTLEGLPAFQTTYDEGLKIGYKWYDAEKKPVLFLRFFEFRLTLAAQRNLPVQFLIRRIQLNRARQNQRLQSLAHPLFLLLQLQAPLENRFNVDHSRKQ